MPRNSPPQEFGPLLRKFFREHKREPALTLNQLREHWTAIAGEEMGSRTRPAKLARGTLWVDTPDACWAYELQFFKQDLLNSIQAFIDASTVTDLRFTVAREPQPPASVAGGQEPPAHSLDNPGPVATTAPNPTAFAPAAVTPPAVEPASYQNADPAYPAAAGNPPSALDAGAGQKAPETPPENPEGGVLEAFQRMRAKRLKGV